MNVTNYPYFKKGKTAERKIDHKPVNKSSIHQRNRTSITDEEAKLKPMCLLMQYTIRGHVYWFSLSIKKSVR